MIYFWIGIFIAVLLSIILAVRSERRFQKKLDHLIALREEIENISIRLDRIKNNEAATVKKIRHSSSKSYDLKNYDDFNEILFEPSVGFDIELGFLSNYHNYDSSSQKNLLRKKKSKFPPEKNHNNNNSFYTDISLENYA